jgi:pimeloyl-ACP methyl ester carboxylesterase
MTQPTRKEIAREGGHVSYLEWESSRPALHFAHATGFNGEVYSTLLAPLAAHFRVFACDQRGHGFTTLPTAPGLPKNWAIYGTDLNAFLSSVHPGPLVLAGHSMGAIVSLMVAAQHPERVRALVLAEPVLVPTMTQTLARIKRMAGLAPSAPNLADRAERRREIFASFDEIFFAYRGRGAFATWPEAALRDYLHGGLISTGNGTEVRLACTPAWEAETFRNTPIGIARLARQVHCPITILIGENGTANEREVSTIERLHRSTRVVRVPGASHFLPMERPDTVREEIERIAHKSGA